MPIPKLLNTILQVLSLTLSRHRLRGNGFNLCFRHGIYDDGRKDLLESTHDVLLDYLSCDICDECLLLNLQVVSKKKCWDSQE